MFREVKEPYDPRVLEERVIKFWQENDIYRKARDARASGPLFSFVDGPPYTTGRIHLGTAMNKSIKDIYLRYKSMRGFRVADRPGWDMHGLPIEVKVEAKLGFTTKKEIETYGLEAFIEECRKFAISNMNEMTLQFKRLGVWMDWEKPYRTLDADYMDAAWWAVKRAHENGLLERGYRVVNWCPRCETALAEAEIDYAERRDPSIYVKFPLSVAGMEGVYLVIWTTTPWTLPANMASAVDESEDYALVSAVAGGKKERLVMAKDLVDQVLTSGGYDSWDIERTFPGSDMVGWEYDSPLEHAVPYQQEVKHRVCAADFVTMENTGIVHIAPGHGQDDFRLGQQEGIEAFSPVDDSGKMNDDAGKYSGLGVWDANDVIMSDLKESGYLLQSSHVDHRYGHCWRCKSPIIFRATDQWFISISKIKDDMLKSIEDVKWHPEWAGSARFRDWLEGARDWCISRQRYWGIPIPVWMCDACGMIRVFGSRKELEELLDIELNDIHRPSVDSLKIPCPCSTMMYRVPDIFDVWLDSAVASWATVGFPALIDEDELMEKWPADLIIEGHDQTRGWFYSQLGASMASHGKPPYREVIMHGFALDSERRAMSKSIGNVMDPMDIVNGTSDIEGADTLDRSGGADTLRLFVTSQKPPWDDLVFTPEGLVNAYRALNVFWNLHRFPLPYMAMDSFKPGEIDYDKIKKDLRREDKWLLSRTQNLVLSVEASIESAELHNAARALTDFVLEDFSRWYLQLARRRTWIEKDDPDKLAAYFTIWEALTTAIKVSAPFTPFIAEMMYQNVVVSTDMDVPPSVHMSDWPDIHKEWCDNQLESEMSIVRGLIETVLHIRNTKMSDKDNPGDLRLPVPRVIIISDNDDVKKAIISLEKVFQEQANTEKIRTYVNINKFSDVKYEIKPVYEKLGPLFKDNVSKVIFEVNKLSPNFINEKIISGKSFEVELEGETLEIQPSMFTISHIMPKDMIELEFNEGIVIVDFNRDDDLQSKGIVRTVIRHLQKIRQDLDLDINEFTNVYIENHDSKIINDIIKDKKDYISAEVRAKITNLVEGKDFPDFCKQHEIGVPFGYLPLRFGSIQPVFNEFLNSLKKILRKLEIKKKKNVVVYIQIQNKDDFYYDLNSSRKFIAKELGINKIEIVDQLQERLIIKEVEIKDSESLLIGIDIYYD